MTICTTCYNLDWNRLPTNPKPRSAHSNSRTLNIGRSETLEWSASLGCTFCKILYTGVCTLRQHVYSARIRSDSAQELNPYDIQIILEPGRPLILRTESSPASFDEADGLEILYYTKRSDWNILGREEPILPAFGFANDVAPESTLEGSLPLIEGWLSRCNRSHDCYDQYKPGKLPRRVLDLGSRNQSRSINLIEPNDIADKYATLSHRWGTKNLLRTLKSNIEDHKQGIDWTSLSKTFQDAIELIRALGLRYIWIDSLCIIQDDSSDWEIESSKMAEIYSKSYLNMAATASKGGNKGLFFERWVEINLDRCANKTIDIEFGEEGSRISARLALEAAHTEFSYVVSGGEIYGNTAPLLLRSWVLQERFLAPRTVHFHGSELVWECNESLTCECGYLSDNSEVQRSIRKLKVSKQDNTLHATRKWMAVVNEYTRLDITYASDRLPALAGLASQFQPQIRSRYLAGLWEVDLPRGLLWSKYITNPTNIRENPFQAPSWSWVSALWNDTDATIFEPPTYHLLEHMWASFHLHPDIKYLGTSCTLASSNPFGHVSAGCLRLRGQMIPALVTVKEHFHFEPMGGVVKGEHLLFVLSAYEVAYTYIINPQYEASYFGIDLLLQRMSEPEDDFVIIDKVALWPDIDIFAGKERMEVDEEVFCLRMGSGRMNWYNLNLETQGNDVNDVGLVLKKSPSIPGSFERIGVMFCKEAANWFRDSSMETVDIV